jgi:hypothetical protein
MEFAIVGAALTFVAVALFSWRVIRPRQTETHVFRLLGTQAFLIALFLISYRFWIASVAFPIAIGVILFIIYVASWLAPSYASSTVQKFYREIWLPESKPMRTLVAILLGLGGGAGALGASVGMNLSDVLGGGIWLFMAIFTTATLIVGTLYISAQLWRLQRGISPIPTADEQALGAPNNSLERTPKVRD